MKIYHPHSCAFQQRLTRSADTRRAGQLNVKLKCEKSRQPACNSLHPAAEGDKRDKIPLKDAQLEKCAFSKETLECDAQRALLVTPWEAGSIKHQHDVSWKHPATLQLVREDKYPPLSIARYSFIQLRELEGNTCPRFHTAS